MNASFNTTEQINAYNMIAKTNMSFFLTGRAGTGKTTFLKMIQKELSKRFVVLAPTGIAAYNAGGQTIHSFFGFDRLPKVPGEFGRMSQASRDIVKHIDAIIVDEVSMVRCDIIDAMDRTLRYVRKNSAPFGGLQMIFVGDMYQLEPVTNQKDRETLEQFYPYGCYYFYKAAVIQRYSLPKIEFKKIYRQQDDPLFIELLEHIRTGNVSYQDLYRLNERVVDMDERNPKMKITLTCKKDAAQNLNDSKLNELPGVMKSYDATIVGNIKNCADCAPEVLNLKVGAQVMFTKNDSEHRWYNGTLGKIESLTDDTIKVRLDSGVVYEVPQVTWDSIEYRYNEETKQNEKEIVGSLIQYPLKLAWAITIHKSQSLTFDRVAIDFGNGAFSNGQAYVALSRCRTLNGLELLSPMTSKSVRVSSDVKDFSSDCNNDDLITREICIGEAIGSATGIIDFDNAAVNLYDLAAKESNKGNYAIARDYMKRALSYVIDDECLKGHEWLAFDSDNMDNQILNATGLYYDDRKEEAEFILSSYGRAIDDNLDALYILSRCYEDSEEWDKVEDVYGKMYAIRERVKDSGQDSISFRKLRYRLAVLNEKHYGDPGAGLIRQLIDENPGYDKYHLAMRWMLAKNEKVVQLATEEDDDSSLVKMLFDSNVNNEQYISQLCNEREDKTLAWRLYRVFINNLELSLQ